MPKKDLTGFQNLLGLQKTSPSPTKYKPIPNEYKFNTVYCGIVRIFQCV